jgi:ABC-2 type transport system ATP-binding protein
VIGMSLAIEISGLVKTFGHTRALDGLDLEVRPGEVHAFLGPNGSGKSTTLRVLLGLLRADAGTVHLLGGDPWRDATTLHRRLAYVPGDIALWPNLTGGEVIDLLGRLRGGLDERRRADLIDAFDLDPTTKCRAYSKGNRQKVGLIAALTSPVELYLLDEPTSGLDPLKEEVFRGCIDEVRGRGATVLLSSHILAEAEALSDRVTIIRKGKAVASGSLEDLRHLTRTAITAQLADPVTAVVPRLAGLAGVYAVHGEDHRVQFEVDANGLDHALVVLTDVGVRGLVSRPPTLEEIFLRHYSDQLPHEAGSPVG